MRKKKDTTATNPRIGEKRRALLRAILGFKDAAECVRFFDDLCTPAEIAAMSDRWAVVRLVAAGVPYRRIHETTKVSTATITRVARAYFHGTGGYRTVLGRFKGKTK